MLPVRVRQCSFTPCSPCGAGSTPTISRTSAEQVNDAPNPWQRWSTPDGESIGAGRSPISADSGQLADCARSRTPIPNDRLPVRRARLIGFEGSSPRLRHHCITTVRARPVRRNSLRLDAAYRPLGVRTPSADPGRRPERRLGRGRRARPSFRTAVLAERRIPVMGVEAPLRMSTECAGTLSEKNGNSA